MAKSLALSAAREAWGDRGREAAVSGGGPAASKGFHGILLLD